MWRRITWMYLTSSTACITVCQQLAQVEQMVIGIWEHISFSAWAELTFSRWVSIKNWIWFGIFFISVTNVQIVSSRISSLEGKVNRCNVSIAWTHLIKMDFIHCSVSVFVSITSTRSSLSEWYTVVTMFLTIWKSDMEFSCFGFIFQHPQAEWLVSTFR